MLKVSFWLVAAVVWMRISNFYSIPENAYHQTNFLVEWLITQIITILMQPNQILQTLQIPSFELPPTLVGEMKYVFVICIAFLLYWPPPSTRCRHTTWRYFLFSWTQCCWSIEIIFKRSPTKPFPFTKDHLQSYINIGTSHNIESVLYHTQIRIHLHHQLPTFCPDTSQHKINCSSAK